VPSSTLLIASRTLLIHWADTNASIQDQIFNRAADVHLLVQARTAHGYPTLAKSAAPTASAFFSDAERAGYRR
jgi:hypothetical protein